MLPTVSVIVTTYNWPQALNRVLSGLCQQSYQGFEIIVADDGSVDATAEVVRSFKAKCKVPLLHCWQPDEGFRAAMCRNRAAATARNDYLIFIDGDCVPLPTFVENHAKIAQQNYFVAGNRILLNQQFTDQILQQSIAIEQWGFAKWLAAACQGHCNGVLSLATIPFGQARTWCKHSWKGVKTCNLGLWRKDYIKVNGIDENYFGWGFEDSDLVVRLLRANIYRKSGKYATGVLHLWHPQQDRNMAEENAARLQHTLHASHTQALKGINQYL